MIACPNLSNPDVAREFEELRNATTSDAAAYRIWSLNNGNPIDKAPNGAESILFKQLLDKFNGDRVLAIRAKAKLYSNSFLNRFGDWTGLVTYQVYQGRRTKEVDDRRYNYWSLNENEVIKDYGPIVRTSRINPDGFLIKNVYKKTKDLNGNDVYRYSWSDEYKKAQDEFEEKYGYEYGFDILDNSEEGLKKLNLFFEFLESKGYKGYSEYDMRVYDLGENPYTVTFGDIGIDKITGQTDENGEPLLKYTTDEYVYDIHPLIENKVVLFCKRLGFDLLNTDVDTFVDFASKIINISDFNVLEFNKIKAKIASVLMNPDLKNELLSTLRVNPKNSSEVSKATKVIEKSILNILNNKGTVVRKNKSLAQKILDFIRSIIDKFLKNQEYYEKLILEAVRDINNVNSKWYKTIIQDGFELKNLDINKLKDSPLYNAYNVLTSLGASLDGSAAVRAQGTLYRKSEEDFHDLDFTKPYDSFSYDVKIELDAFFNSYRVASNNFTELDKVVYKDLRSYMLENVDEHLKKSKLYKELSKYYKDIKIRHAAKTKELGLFVTIEIDGFPVDIFYCRNVKQYNINGIKVSDFSVPFAAKLVMRREKDIRDIINFHKLKLNEQNNSESEDVNISTESVFEYAESLLNEVDQLLEESSSNDVRKTVQQNGKIRLSLPSHTEKNPRQIVLEPQGNNKFYVHMRIWDGEKVPGKITNDEKRQLFDALYEELPEGAEILFPKSGEGYYATRGTVAGLLRLSRDPRFLKGSAGELQYLDEDGSVKTFSGTSFIKAGSKSAVEQWAENKQKEILGETQLQLAEVFGLERQKDGSLATSSKDETAQLRVLFVNAMSDPGSIDFAVHSERVHSLICIGLNKADASTFNHELAHYYIRMFWNSKVVQQALDMVYVKEMGDYQNDELAKIAVEEALADYMTQQSMDNMFMTNIESRSYFQRFWEAFNKMLYNVFDIKTNTAKTAILNQAVKSFLVNQTLERNKKYSKYTMHEGTMHQTEYQKRKGKITDKVEYKDISRNKLESTVKKIVDAILSKAKSYSLQSTKDATGVYGNEQQIAFNLESVRIVKEFVKKVNSSRADRDDVREMMDKVELFEKFLERADIEIDRVLRMLKNARANDRFSKLMYNEDSTGQLHYDDATGQPITEANATAETKERAYTWDDLQYAKNDIVGFFASTIKNIYSITNDAHAYGIDAVKAQEIADFINSKGLIQRIETIEDLYKEARRLKCLEWIDESVESREELNDDFKNRLRINMRKWLDEQMDFGDVSIFEVYIGMGSRSKSPIIKLLQDDIANMVDEKENIVYEKMLSLRDQLAKAKKEMGLKYRLFPFNVQKLLLLLNKHGLPTGNLILRYNTGQYHEDLENFKNEKLFGKNGVEAQLKKLTDISGDPICRNDDGTPWKLMLDEYGNPIIPNHPDCYDIEKQYLRDLEEFRCDREQRRYTKKYYLERLRFLSIPTLRALTEIEQRIDELTRAVTINNKLRLDLLTDQLQVVLKTLYQERAQLASPYNEDGTIKLYGTQEYEIAKELMDWHVYCNDKIKYTSDWDAYDDAYNHARDKRKFERLFATYQINPTIWEWVESHALCYDTEDPDYKEWKRLKAKRSKLVAPYKGYEIGEFAWSKIYDDTNNKIINEEFFKELQQLDEQISELSSILHDRYEKTGIKYPKGLRKIFSESMIPYHFIPGVTNWQSTFLYTAMNLNIENLIMSDNTLTYDQKIRLVNYYKNLLTYHDAESDAYVPLSVFSELTAAQGAKTRLKYSDDKDDYIEVDSYVVLPGNMFSMIDVLASDSDFINKEYDLAKVEQEGQTVFLKDTYLDKRYDKYISKNKELEKLLEMVKDTMREGFECIPFLTEYDGRAAQIGARTGQILGRKWYNLPRMIKNIGEFLRREWEVVETDTDFLEESTYETRPDGSKIQNIPIRFIKRLDDPTYINSDVVGSAIKFFDMAQNYRIKTKHVGKLTSVLGELSKFENQMLPESHKTFSALQSDVVRGILDRLVYESKNADTSDKEYIFENPWKHLDWIRKYVISNPASWIKRLRKSRAAFLLGMLALNATSGMISFLDPLVSITLDMITGKYINCWDAAYALGRMFTNLPGNAMSLGKIKSYSKAAAAMLRFQLSKSIYETSEDMDQGLIMRFLSSGLTMKHFTLGDYTINSMNMIATMHNYKYYTSDDGTVKEFLPKPLWIQKKLKEGYSLKDAKKLYNNAICMWDCCEVDKQGKFVAKSNRKADGSFKTKYDEAGSCITDVTFRLIKKQVRDRSSLYNGIVPDLEKSLMQTNIIWSFVTMLRNFFITGIWERFQTYRDFQVASLDEDGDPIDRTATYLEIKEAKAYQRYYKGGLNLNTRQIEDGVDVSCVRWLKHIGPYLRMSLFAITHPAARSKYSNYRKGYMKTHNIAQTDIYGLQKVLMEFLVFSMLLMASGFTMRAALDDDNKDNYGIQMTNLLTLRLAIERATWLNPSTAMDLISSPTAALSDWKRKMKLFDLFYDYVGLSDHELTEEVKSGRYVGAQRWKYNLFNGLSSFGVNNWYADMPEELGGGGAKSVAEKANFYKGLVKQIPVAGPIIVPSKKEEKQIKLSTRRGRPSRPSRPSR